MFLIVLFLLAALGAFGYLAYEKGLSAAVAGALAVGTALAAYAMGLKDLLVGLFS